MSNISILPTLLTHRSDQLGKSQLVIRIYHQRRIASVINTGQKCSKKFWDSKMREVKRGEQNYSLINSLIKNKVSDLQKKFMEAELRGQPLTKEKIKTIVTGKDYNKDFIAYCRDRIPDRYPSPSQKETRRSYFGELTKLESFQKSISFGDLSPHFFSKYKAWLIKDRYNSDNTVWKALKFINTMINDAIPAGFITDNPFKQFHRGTYKQGRPVYLTMPECEAF